MKWPWQRHNDEPAKRFASGKTALYDAMAIDQLVNWLGLMPEADEVLRKAGKGRSELRKLAGDDEIAGAMETRLTALLSIPWRLEPFEDDPVAKELWPMLEPHIEALIRAAWAAVPFGYSVFELVYARGPRIGISQVRALPFEWFTIDVDQRLRYRPNGVDLVGELVDETFKFFGTVRNPEVRQPTGDPLLSKVFWPWFFRSNGWKFWGTFLERHGAPFTLGKTGGDVQKMADALVRMVQSGVAAVGKDDDVQAISPGNAGDAFDKFSSAVDRRIQKVILGQTLTTDVQGGGSFAAAKVHNMVREDRLMADIRLITPTVQRVINALVALNWPGSPVPSFIMEAGEGLAVERANRDAVLKNAGVRFTKQYWLDHYDFEEGDIDDAPEPPPMLPGVPAADAKFSARPGRFTPDQESVEDLVAATLERAASPVPAADIRAAITGAQDEQDLLYRLGELFAKTDRAQARELLERALFAASVMGFAAAEPSSADPEA
jgi:phage gp29-like protein